MLAALSLAGCAQPPADAGSTDQFLRSALDAYGVIAVAPAGAPTPRSASTLPTQRLTREEVCRGRFGPQPDYIDARTRRPIDCGPGV
jgi:hypothetical protein